MADCCYKRSCPAPVSAVSVYNTVIHMSDGNIDLFKQEELTLTGATATLSFLPYTDASLKLFLNGVLLVSGRDYTRDLKAITFIFDPLFDATTSTIMAVYVGTDYAVLEGALRPGMIVPAATAANYTFIGFLVCDGASLLVASYPALFAAIGYTYGGSGANFNIPNLTNAFVDGSSNFATGPVWIKI